MNTINVTKPLFLYIVTFVLSNFRIIKLLLNVQGNVFIGRFKAAGGVCLLVIVAIGENTPHWMTPVERHYLDGNAIVYYYGHCNIQ